MKAVKATVKEVNENFLSQKEEEMPQIFPPAMVALAKSASLVLGGSEALRELLLDSLGSEAWESVDQLVQTVNREAVSAPLVVLKTDAAEVAKPQRLWRKKLEAIGTAWRITRLALTAIFSPMTAVAWMVTGAVLSRFGGPLFIVLDAWNRLRRRLFVKALFTVAFSTEQKEEWKALIEELKGHVVRTGKLNFSLKGNPRSLKAISVTPYKVVGKLGYENKTTPKLSAPFLESNLVLDPSNATREIEKMVTTCELLPPGERALFLNLKMKSVPVPSKGSDLWYSDIIAAQRNGIHSIAVHTGISTRDDLLAYAPDMLLPDLRGLTLSAMLKRTHSTRDSITLEICRNAVQKRTIGMDVSWRLERTA